MTLTANIGNFYSPVHKRVWTCSELWTAMGFPVAPETIDAACCSASQFARHLPVPPTRSIKAQRRQVGNTMHVNVMGAFQFILLCKFPGLGRDVAEDCGCDDGGRTVGSGSGSVSGSFAELPQSGVVKRKLQPADEDVPDQAKRLVAVSSSLNLSAFSLAICP